MNDYEVHEITVTLAVSNSTLAMLEGELAELNKGSDKPIHTLATVVGVIIQTYKQEKERESTAPKFDVSKSIAILETEPTND